MKKLVAMSLVAVMGMAGSAFAENARLSDVVRTLEENPELIGPVNDMLNAARAVSSFTTNKYKWADGVQPVQGVLNPIKVNPTPVIGVNPVLGTDPVKIVPLDKRYNEITSRIDKASRSGDWSTACKTWESDYAYLTDVSFDPQCTMQKRKEAKEMSAALKQACK